MTVRVGAGVSSGPDPVVAGARAARGAESHLEGAPAELAIVFASGEPLAAAEALLATINETLAPAALVGCGAGGVLGQGTELESGSGVAVWAANFGGLGVVTSFRATADDGMLEGLPSLERSTGAVMLSDPYSFPTDVALSRLGEEAPTVPVLGGLASARGERGTLLFHGDEVHTGGAVGVGFEGIELLPCVSQGAAPLGRELTITRAEGNLIHELAGRPALETIQQVVTELSPRERTLLASGLLIGIVIDSGRPEFEQGDFLVRGVIGADSDSGTVAVGAHVHPGQVVRLHARDAQSADQDLRRALRLRLEALSGQPPAGALVFSCNGRGRAMFGVPDHDAAAIADELGGAPAAGFFAAGEIGPVGGRSFLHGFTATIALFAADTLPGR